MSDLIITGTVMGIAKEAWIQDLKLFSSTLITVMNNWANDTFHTNGTWKTENHHLLKKSFGEVRQALFAMENDIHNLSVCYNQLLYTVHDEKLKNGRRSLFLNNLVEFYFTNIRSVYDHMSIFPRIVCPERFLKQGFLKLSSLNDFIKLSKNHKHANEALGPGIIWAANTCLSDLTVIKAIRDAIIHHGHNPIVNVNSTDDVSIKIPKRVGIYSSEDLLPPINDMSENENKQLFPYLKAITTNLLVNMEKFGNTIYKRYVENVKPWDEFYLFALQGIYMEEFQRFLFPKGRSDNFFKNAMLDSSK